MVILVDYSRDDAFSANGPLVGHVLAFIRGVFGKVAIIRSPSDLNTSPNAAVKTGSRS